MLVTLHRVWTRLNEENRSGELSAYILYFKLYFMHNKRSNRSLTKFVSTIDKIVLNEACASWVGYDMHMFVSSDINNYLQAVPMQIVFMWSLFNMKREREKFYLV